MTTISDIYKISHLLRNAPEGEYNIILYCDDKDKIKEMAQELNVFLYHPHDSHPRHWFVYSDTNNPKRFVDIRVEGPYI